MRPHKTRGTSDTRTRRARGTWSARANRARNLADSTFLFDCNDVRTFKIFNEQLGVFLNVKQQKWRQIKT